MTPNKCREVLERIQGHRIPMSGDEHDAIDFALSQMDENEEVKRDNSNIRVIHAEAMRKWGEERRVEANEIATLKARVEELIWESGDRGT